MTSNKHATYSAAASLDLLRHVTLERRVQGILNMVEVDNVYAIRALATEFGLSPTYLQRLFKKETGVRLGEWLSEQRLRRAEFLLSNSSLSIKEIAHAAGYEHTSSFNRAFERRFLQPPAHYRKHNEGEYPVDQRALRDSRRLRIIS